MTSKTQTDHLGARLRDGAASGADLRLLADCTSRFAVPYVEVLAMLNGVGLRPTGRMPKSLESIVAKLRRESIRLTQIQDIARCRVVVVGLAQQDDVARRLAHSLAPAVVDDRRAARRHHYRAIHVIVERHDLQVEVQIRTAWQHHWAATSEKLADEFGQALKYGRAQRASGMHYRAGRTRSGRGRNGWQRASRRPELHSKSRRESKRCINSC